MTSLVIIVLVLLLGGGRGCYGRTRWGAGGRALVWTGHTGEGV